MIAKMIDGCTRVLGKAQGYLGLATRDEVVDGHDTMVSSWEPTPKELRALIAGANVYVRIRGNLHPPISVGIQ